MQNSERTSNCSRQFDGTIESRIRGYWHVSSPSKLFKQHDSRPFSNRGDLQLRSSSYQSSLN
ncbi:hypothetical protein ES705_34988 [subsurface metagenome]